MPCRVSPFGHPRFIACLPAPRGFSQAPTSFIASCCQGIHHMPFVALNTNRNATNEGSMRKHQTYALVTLSENYLRSLSKLTLLKPYFSIQNFKERSDVWSLKIRQRWKIRKPLVYLDAYEPKLKVRLLKEVIQPQVPLRLPCYDFTPVMDHTVVSALPKVRLPNSGAIHSHGVTGGVYKTRDCLLYTSPSPRDRTRSRMPSSA